MSSAIQKAYHPCEMPEIFMKIQRHGTSNISWRMEAPIILMIPFPSPEEKYPQRIVMADITKEMEIILSAGIPRVSISELAENNWSNRPGKHQNMIVPHKAMIAPVGSKTFVCRKIPQQYTRLIERYCLQSSWSSESAAILVAIASDRKIPIIEKIRDVRSIRKSPVVAAWQASSFLCSPIFLESNAFRPTVVPTPTAIIKNWME